MTDAAASRPENDMQEIHPTPAPDLADCAARICRAREADRLPAALHTGGIKHTLGCFITLLREAMYPDIYGVGNAASGDAGRVRECLEGACLRLTELCRAAMEGKTEEEIGRIVSAFFSQLPAVAEQLAEDVRAAYDGDPAAKSTREIMCAYPSFEALVLFRPAHILYRLGVPLIPRMMTEYAHRITGIDIHPGATIGRRFFIDHGTGVVIGETCVIGDDVKLYQGVTLGAKSFATDADGLPVKGIKRHPEIRDRVVIYAGATILGGDTVVGEGAVIGGNVWLTHSVPPGVTVTCTDARRQARVQTPAENETGKEKHGHADP